MISISEDFRLDQVSLGKRRKSIKDAFNHVAVPLTAKWPKPAQLQPKPHSLTIDSEYAHRRHRALQTAASETQQRR